MATVQAPRCTPASGTIGIATKPRLILVKNEDTQRAGPECGMDLCEKFTLDPWLHGWRNDEDIE